MAFTPSRKCCLAWFLVWPVALLATEKSPSPPSELPGLIPPLPALVAYANAHSIPLDGVDLAAGPIAGHPGDAVTALVNLRDGKVVKQWLVHLQIATPTEKERAENQTPEVTVTVNDHTHKFSGGVPLALDIRTVGPLVAGDKPPTDEKHARALISPDLLALGLDKACAVFIKRSNNAADAPADAKATTLTDQEERAVGGMFPALFAFFIGIQGTPGLRDILWDITEKPSVWAIVKSGGKIKPGFNVGNDFAVVEPGAWAMPGSELYRMGIALSINDQPALQVSLVVTSPRPPLLTTAGIVGIVAQPPGKKDKRMDLRVIAAHRAKIEASASALPQPR